ncbi:MAG TPA: hypothetical protein VLH10_10885, partial [Yinghuangia sp.]|nr:hypothetical protein [Yinghuangia sp.]
PSPDDGRVSLVSLTPRGDAVRRRLTSVMDQHLNEMLSKWSEEDRAAFAVLLGRFVDDMATTELHATVEDDDDTD